MITQSNQTKEVGKQPAPWGMAKQRAQYSAAWLHSRLQGSWQLHVQPQGGKQPYKLELNFVIDGELLLISQGKQTPVQGRIEGHNIRFTLSNNLTGGSPAIFKGRLQPDGTLVGALIGSDTYARWCGQRLAS